MAALLSRPRRPAGRRCPRHTTLATALAQTLDVAPRRCLFILASDFYEDVKTLTPLIRRLRFERHDFMALQIADPAEIDFTFNDPALFQDIETGDEIPADPAALARSYREQFTAHRLAISDLCTSNGFESFALRTDEAPLETLRDGLARRLAIHRSYA